MGGSLRALRATTLTVRCACWALLHNAGHEEDAVRCAVHDMWVPGLQRITGPWTLKGDPRAMRRLQAGGALSSPTINP